MGGWEGGYGITYLFLSLPEGALPASTGTHGYHMGASAGPVPALKALEAGGTLLLLAIGMATRSRSCATVRQATQVSS